MEPPFAVMIPGASKLEKEPSIVEIVDTELENSPSRITLLRGISRNPDRR